MKCIVFSHFNNKEFIDYLAGLKFQSGVEADIYLMISESFRHFHHAAGNIDDRIEFNAIDGVHLNEPSDYDKVYIIGSNFALRKELMNNGFDHKNISMCYGDISTCHCPLDEVFIIPKSKPEIPFEKKPAEIYQHYEGETSRSHARRKREGFFEKYCRGEGLDIGYGGDILTPECSGWDFRNGDAQYLSGIEAESFDFVYSSHCLEHMYDVRTALKNWFRVVRRGGFLILAIPHRDLYEKRTQLPSRWNGDHKHMFLIGKAEPPDTLDIIEEVRESLNDYDIKYVKACDEGHTITDPNRHSDGEYQIEMVIQKRS